MLPQGDPIDAQGSAGARWGPWRCVATARGRIRAREHRQCLAPRVPARGAPFVAVRSARAILFAGLVAG